MTHNELPSIIRAAAIQHRLLSPRRNDRRFIARGGTVLHTVDTDVITLYTRPWEEAPSSRRRKEGYAEIFPGDDRQIVIALGEALAKFIFYRLSDLPLLVLPPMREEVSRVFSVVASNAEHDSITAYDNLEKIESLIRAAEGKECMEAAKMLEEHADTISRFLLGHEGAMAELRRFGLLVRDSRLASPEFLIDNKLIDDPVMQAALEPPSTLIERIRFSELRENWLGRLRVTKSSLQKPELTNSDALVLARIEWINAMLAAKKEGDQTRHRVVLITGDSAMHRAAAAVSRWGGSPFNFGELFLRHPKAYLAEPGVLEPPSEVEQQESAFPGDTQFDQWLDTWLSKLNPGAQNFLRSRDELLEKNDKQLHEWAAPLLSTRPGLLNDFYTAWSKYTRNLVLDGEQPLLTKQLAKAKERKVIDDYQHLFARLSDAIDERIRETWRECFNVAAKGGASLFFARSHSVDGIRSRNPPLLTFDRFQKTREFIKLVQGDYRVGGVKTTEWNAALDQLEEDDKTGYVFFLGLGLLFTHKIGLDIQVHAVYVWRHEYTKPN